MTIMSNFTDTALPAVTRYTFILSLITDSLSGIRLYLIAARSAVIRFRKAEATPTSLNALDRDNWDKLGKINN